MLRTVRIMNFWKNSTSLMGTMRMWPLWARRAMKSQWTRASWVSRTKTTTTQKRPQNSSFWLTRKTTKVSISAIPLLFYYAKSACFRRLKIKKNRNTPILILYASYALPTSSGSWSCAMAANSASKSCKTQVCWWHAQTPNTWSDRSREAGN